MNRAGLGRQRVLALAAGSALLLLLLDRVVFTPVLAGWRARAAEIATLQAAIATGSALLDQETRWQRWRDETGTRLLPAAPADAEGRLLTQVDGWARQAGLKVTALRPQWQPRSGGLPLVQLQVTASGPLSAIVPFLYQLETAQTALAIEQLSLTPARQEGGDLSLDVRLSGLCATAVGREGQP